MLLGIMSDSHGDATMVRRAVALFDAEGVEHIIHCGDVGGVDVFDQIVGRPFSFVWGNCDVESGQLFAYLNSVGVALPDDIPTMRSFAGKRVAVFHGHEPGFSAFLRRPQAEYLFHGHTHIACDEHVNGARVINPGALHRAKVKTVATLDVLTDQLQFHEIVHGG